MAELEIVSDAGYQALVALKDRTPELFTDPNPERLKAAMPAFVPDKNEAILWDEPIPLHGPVDAINNNPKAGKADDAQNVRILSQALPQLGPRDWHQERLWASINCFALADWVPVRWSLGRTKNTKDRDFVRRHWLNANIEARQSNASMRLFTLNVLSLRASTYSTHTYDELLEAMADKVNLFHRSLGNPYLIANSRLLAYIWDTALDDQDDTSVFQTRHANTWLMKINERGGAVDLGTLDDHSLRSIVEEAKPRPKAP